MKNHFIIYSLSFMEVIMQAMVFLAAVMILSFGFFYTPQATLGKCLMISFIPSFILYFARHYLKNNALFIAAHIGTAVFILTIGNSLEEKISYVIVGIAMLIYSIVITTSENKKSAERMPVPLVLFFAVEMFISKQGNHIQAENAALICGIIFILMQVVCRNLQNIYDFILINRETTGLPIKQMLSVNGFIMTILLTICGGIMFLCNSTYMFRMLQSMGILLRNVLAAFLRLFIRGDQEPEYIIPEPVETESVQYGMEQLPEPEDGPIRDILNGLAILVFVIIMIVAVIAIAAALARAVKYLKGAGGLESDVKEFITPGGIEKFRLARRKKNNEPKDEPGNLKARKIYRNTVKKNAVKKGVKIYQTMTPSELSQACIENVSEEVTQIYEKARYSNTEVSQQEIELLQKVQKNKI